MPVNKKFPSPKGILPIGDDPLGRIVAATHELAAVTADHHTPNSSADQASRRRITMRDIALKLGIDRSTVSLSLRGHPRISKTLRQKVEETAGQMGYQPDPMLSALAYYRHSAAPNPVTPGLAWINRGVVAGALRSNEEMNGFFEGAYETARNNGYMLHDLWLDPEEPILRSKKHFKKNNIKGLLIPSQFQELSWEGMVWEKYAIVGVGYFSSSLPIHSVVPDQMQAGVLGFQKAYEKGYRRIGLCTGREAKIQGWRYVPGFRMAQFEVPEAEQVPVLELEEIAPEKDRIQLLNWMKKYAVDAILTSVPNLRSRLETIGYNVPEDVVLAAANLAKSDADAGVEHNSFEMGRLAVETVISHLNHNHRGIPKVACSHSIEPQWVEGATLPERH